MFRLICFSYFGNLYSEYSIFYVNRLLSYNSIAAVFCFSLDNKFTIRVVYETCVRIYVIWMKNTKVQSLNFSHSSENNFGFVNEWLLSYAHLKIENCLRCRSFQRVK